MAWAEYLRDGREALCPGASRTMKGNDAPQTERAERTVKVAAPVSPSWSYVVDMVCVCLCGRHGVCVCDGHGVCVSVWWTWCVCVSVCPRDVHAVYSVWYICVVYLM